MSNTNDDNDDNFYIDINDSTNDDNIFYFDIEIKLSFFESYNNNNN